MAIDESNPEADFEPQRRHLMAVAYRLVGSLAEAEDLVQEAYLRWHDTDRSTILNVRAFLSKVLVRLCLDHLKKARVRREQYVGVWLPEPVLDDEALTAETASELADDLSVGLMLALERLSPLERAAFLLHDVFDLDFAEVAQTVGRTEAACRQLAARARAHVQDSRPRFRVSRENGARIAEAFLVATRTGDVQTLTRLLAEDAVLHSDGGGKRPAALRPIPGRDKITRFLKGLASKADLTRDYLYTLARINGQAGYLVTEPDGSVMTVALDIRDGQIVSIYIVRNPEKLRHLHASSEDAEDQA